MVPDATVASASSGRSRLRRWSSASLAMRGRRVVRARHRRSRCTTASARRSLEHRAGGGDDGRAGRFGLRARRGAHALVARPTSTLLTLHGRPVERARAAYRARRAPAHACARRDDAGDSRARGSTTRGFGESRMVALAHMGGPRESRTTSTRATSWSTRCARPAYARGRMRRRPGCDLVSAHRAFPTTLSSMTARSPSARSAPRRCRALMPHPGALLWDVGAGCGSIAIEWMRAADRARAIAIEPDAGRRALVAANAATLGVPALELIEGEAPGGARRSSRPGCHLHRRRAVASATIAAAIGALKPRRAPRRHMP